MKARFAALKSLRAAYLHLRNMKPLIEDGTYVRMHRVTKLYVAAADTTDLTDLIEHARLYQGIESDSEYLAVPVAAALDVEIRIIKGALGAI